MKRKYIRALAFVLIFLPEPFTTPIGLSLLLFSFILPKTHRVKLKNIEEMVKRYSSYYKLSVYRSIFNSNRRVVFHRINSNKPSSRSQVLPPGKPNNTNVHRHVFTNTTHNFIVPYVKNDISSTGRVFNRRPLINSHIANDKVTHHVMKTDFPPYKAKPEPTVIHHTIKRSQSPPASNEFSPNLIPVKPVSGAKKHETIHRPKINTYNRFRISSAAGRR